MLVKTKMPEVVIAANFRETNSAFEYLMLNAIDLVFVDINMPNESGLEFAKRLREHGNDVKLIFVASHKEYALNAFDVYAYVYIVKPVNQDRLRKTIHRVQVEQQTGLAGAAVSKPVAKEVMFNLLGGIDIRNSRGEMVKWKSSKSAVPFGYLLIFINRRVSMSRIIEDIFGDMLYKNAEIYLNTTVYQLRKLLEINGLKGILQSDSSHYALH